MKPQIFTITLVVTDERSDAFVQHLNQDTRIRTNSEITSVGGTSVQDILSSLSKEVVRAIAEANQ